MSQYRKTLLLVCAILLVAGVSLAQTQKNGLRIVLNPNPERVFKNTSPQDKYPEAVDKALSPHLSSKAMTVTKP